MQILFKKSETTSEVFNTSKKSGFKGMIEFQFNNGYVVLTFNILVARTFFCHNKTHSFSDGVYVYQKLFLKRVCAHDSKLN